jgi:hypothetical protein
VDVVLQAAQAAEEAEQRAAALAAAEAGRAHIAGALRALTGQHERVCAEGRHATEELQQLTGACDQLSVQVRAGVRLCASCSRSCF